MNPNSSWIGGAATCVGSRHAAASAPCQDAAHADIVYRPIVIICDGRGSSSHSQHGSATAVQSFRAACHILEPRISRCLDQELLSAAERAVEWREIGVMLLRSLIFAQEELARTHQLPAAEFEHTVAAAVVGSAACGVIQIGDSCVALVRGQHSELAFPPMNGYHANETYFLSIDPNLFTTACYGIYPTLGLSGMVAFSDGLSPKWIHHGVNKPANAIAQVTAKLECGDWHEGHLDAYIRHPEFWSDLDDDRAVAYLVRDQTKSHPTDLPPTAVKSPAPVDYNPPTIIHHPVQNGQPPCDNHHQTRLKKRRRPSHHVNNKNIK